VGGEGNFKFENFKFQLKKEKRKREAHDENCVVVATKAMS